MRIDEVPDLFGSDRPWNPSSVGLIALFAELTQDHKGWLKERYPTLPTVTLP